MSESDVAPGRPDPRGPWRTWVEMQPTPVPHLGAKLDDLDTARIFAAPDNPLEWPAWRESLTRWRDEARNRTSYEGSRYDLPDLAWTQSCFAVALVWLWDELLYDHAARMFTPDRLLADAERRFGGFDGLILWQAYPVIGVDNRNQYDFYRDVPGIRELVSSIQARGVRVFIDFNPWDKGTRRENATDTEALAEIVLWLGADGILLDTMAAAEPGMCEAMPNSAFGGEVPVPLERIADHQLSWAQWFVDSAVPGVLRTRWFEQRHMLHHVARWERDHSAELFSSWLNGTGVVVWENVFGAWVGWSDRDASILRTMLRVQRQHARSLSRGTWTPLAARSPESSPLVVGSRWDSLWTLANTSSEPYGGVVIREGAAPIEVALPPRGIAAILGDDVIAVNEDASHEFPVRISSRRPAPIVHVGQVPDGMVEPVLPSSVVAQFRRRETGIYDSPPCVDDIPNRFLHDWVEVTRPSPTRRFAIGVREVSASEYALYKGGAAGEGPATNVDLAEARAFAAWAGARLPTEDEWQAAAGLGLLDHRTPRVWNWTESEHTNGRTRFAILKGGSAFSAEGSKWYVQGSPQDDSHSLQFLLLGGDLNRSAWIGFRLAVDLEDAVEGSRAVDP